MNPEINSYCFRPSSIGAKIINTYEQIINILDLQVFLELRFLYCICCTHSPSFQIDVTFKFRFSVLYIQEHTFINLASTD